MSVSVKLARVWVICVVILLKTVKHRSHQTSLGRVHDGRVGGCGLWHTVTRMRPASSLSFSVKKCWCHTQCQSGFSADNCGSDNETKSSLKTLEMSSVSSSGRGVGLVNGFLGLGVPDFGDKKEQGRKLHGAAAVRIHQVDQRSRHLVREHLRWRRTHMSANYAENTNVSVNGNLEFFWLFLVFLQDLHKWGKGWEVLLKMLSTSYKQSDDFWISVSEEGFKIGFCTTVGLRTLGVQARCLGFQNPNVGGPNGPKSINLQWKRRCFSEPRICVGWPSSPLSSCPKVFLFKARRVCLYCGTWPLFPHARRFSQTWPATGLDPPSTRSQPPQRTGSSGMCSSSRMWTTKAKTRGTQLDSSRASRRVRVTWSISSGSKTCHSRIGS